MRTKLIVTAAVLAAGIATSMAQGNVYSLNVVGYYNVTVVGGGKFNHVANQLKAGGNTLQEVLPPSVPLADNGVIVVTLTPSGALHEDVTDGTSWFDNASGDPTGTVTMLPPGTSFFFNNPNATIVQTFVGEVPQGDVSQKYLKAPGLNVCASVVPQQLDLSVANGFPMPADQSLKIYWHDTASNLYTFYVTDGADGITWYNDANGDPATLTPPVGKGLFIENSSATTYAWTRNFTVN